MDSRKMARSLTDNQLTVRPVAIRSAAIRLVAIRCLVVVATTHSVTTHSVTIPSVTTPSATIPLATTPSATIRSAMTRLATRLATPLAIRSTPSMIHSMTTTTFPMSRRKAAALWLILPGRWGTRAIFRPASLSVLARSRFSGAQTPLQYRSRVSTWERSMTSLLA